MALYNQKFDLPVGYIQERVLLSDFADGGAAVGTYQMKSGIPIGAKVIATLVTDVTAFAGDTSAVLVVGDGSDADRYNTGTPSIFAAANQVVMGAVSGTAEHVAEILPTLTVTSAADFGDVTGGALTIKIVWLQGR